MVVDRNADGAPPREVGPGSVNLLTGDYTLSPTDASAFGMSVTRTASSRTPDQGARRRARRAIFGKEWVSGTVAEAAESDYTHLRKISATAVDVVTPTATALHFTANAAEDGWIPEPGAEDLTLTGSADRTRSPCPTPRARSPPSPSRTRRRHLAGLHAPCWTA